MKAQDLSKHQWENRILVLMIDQETDIYQKQMKFLQDHEDGLKDRKLLVYTARANQLSIGLKEKNTIPDSSIYNNYKKNNGNFEMILIGLDGSVKERYKAVTKPDDIFKTIDKMPMRRAEMRRDKGW
ncbi:DUF4174 domain-containing protein [Portibacter marinus]|uniref:DUF4174 domain-containing protein n=1 Tax=Portibacter marinus TaxID=2898660 RepID=UPI001F41DF06|nr:DUF4174 domain-containing protein [Portibacter marinus]